jgi:decaprenylphospho-beta-D-ribofuranose 2-oxidase
VADAQPTLVSGWGRTAATAAYLEELSGRADEVSAAVAAAGPRGLVVRGLGRSYGDAAQNAGGTVVRLSPAGHVDLDPVAGVVRVGAGVDLDRLIRELLPQGFFVPVTPGTRHVTVGGAIAADVHGKNHHVDGSIGAHVLRMSLVTADGTLHELTPEGTPDLFWATVGGMGLTGVIVSAVLRVRPVESASMRVDTDRVGSLGELVALMRSTDDDYTYSVAWIDLLARGGSMGRAVLTRGEHARADELPERSRRRPLRLAAGQRLSAPPVVPDGLVNPWTIRAFNEAYFRRAPRQRRDEIQPLGSFFHPLDSVGAWNRLYGRRGFVQYQFVVPLDAEVALTDAVRRISDAGHASFLAVLKRFGPAGSGWLSFPQEGWTLALDLPADPSLDGLLEGLDDLVGASGGRVYLAKDSRSRPATIRRMYPRLEEFRELRATLDPTGRITSDLARRLAL